MLSPYQTGGGAYNTLFGGGGASAQPVLKTDPRPRPTGPGGTVVVAPPDPNNPQAPPPGIDPSTVVRDHRAGHPTWRPDAQQNMTDEDYAAWVANVTHPDQPTLGVDASGAPVPNPNYVPPGAAPAAAGPADPGPPPPITYDPAIGGLDDRQNQINTLLGGAGGRAAPQSAAAILGATAQSADSDARARQSQLADLLQGYATGKDSASMQQLAQARDANVANQLAMAASARPGGAQLASLGAAQNIGTINTALAGQQSLAGINERRSAQDAWAGVLGTQRGQDLNNSQFNAGAMNAQNLAAANLLQQNNQYNTGAQLQQTGLNDAATQGLLGAQLGGMSLQQQSSLSAAQLLAQQRAQELELQNRLQLAASTKGADTSMLTGLLGLGKTGLQLYGQLRNQPPAPSGGGADPAPYYGDGSAPY